MLVADILALISAIKADTEVRKADTEDLKAKTEALKADRESLTVDKEAGNKSVETLLTRYMASSDEKVNVPKFCDNAILAEAKRSDFENTTEKANCVDPSSAISINKYDYSYGRGNNYGKNSRQFQSGSENRQVNSRQYQRGSGASGGNNSKPSLQQQNSSNTSNSQNANAQQG